MAEVTIRHLEIFRAVMEVGSTRQAARRLGITQSAVSQQIRQLEASGQGTLFERSEYRLTATERAHKLYRLTDRLFDEVQQIDNILAETFTEDRFITLAVPHVCSFWLIPKILSAIPQGQEKTIVKIAACNYGNVVEQVLSGQSQLGITRLPVDPTSIEWKTLYTAHSVCLVHPHHPLAQKDHLNLEDLAGERLIAIDRQHASTSMGPQSHVFKSVEGQIKIYFDAVGYEAAYVAQGNGIAITNSFVFRQCQVFDVIAKPFEPRTMYEYVLIWKRHKTVSASQHNLIERISLEVSRMMSS